MDNLIHFACTHAYTAPWIIFLLFFLSGLSLPISEDLLVITGGVIASTCESSYLPYVFCWIYAGSIISGWETYWIGRLFGPRLYDFRWFKRLITPQRIKKMHHYYEKFGVFAFMVIRFCPGGVRAVFFVTAGLGQMPFYKFVWRDALAALIWATTIFALGYYFGANYKILLHYLKTYSHVIIGILILVVLASGFYAWRQSKKKPRL